MKELEGTGEQATIDEGKISIKLKHTVPEELMRISDILGKLFQHGAFNIRHGSISLHFNGKGWLKSISFKATKWQDGEVVAVRVSKYETATVEIDGKLV